MKKRLGIVIGLLLAAQLTACTTTQTGEVAQQRREQAGSQEGIVGELIERPKEAALDTQLAQKQEKLYAYSNITAEQKKLYLDILQTLQTFGKDVPVSTYNEDELATVFQCVMNDHPELFYVAGYTFTKYTVGDRVTQITLSGTYTMSQEEAGEKQKGIDAYTQTCLAGIAPDAGEYEKVKYIYEYLILHTTYNLEAAENQNICSVFLYQQSVCQGYAKAMQYLLNQLNVPATLVVGYVENGDGHAWNLVQINGAYYYVDATWGDAYYALDRGYEEPAQRLPSINYDYLCVTTDQLSLTHTIDNVVPMPRCIQLADNYYVREGAYFTACDKEKLQQLFDKAYEQAQESVTMKCENAKVYADMKRFLLEEQAVFEYLRNSQGSVAYTDNNAQLTISFWL